MARVIVDTWFAAHEGQVSPRVLQRRREEWGYALSERGWRRAIREADGDGSSALVLVAVEQDQLVGVAASERAADDGVEVGTLYVDVVHQRRGIGRRLLEAIIDHWRRAGALSLCIAVLNANREARAFYERLGGREAGFRDHEDGPEVVYRWRLREASRAG